MGEAGTITIVATCACAEPTCPEPGQWRPVVHVYDERGLKIPGEALISNLTVCSGHKDEATANIIEDDSCWEAIVKAFAGWGRRKIIRAKTQIIYEAIQEMA